MHAIFILKLLCTRREGKKCRYNQHIILCNIHIILCNNILIIIIHL